tara:strand:+ start:1669 stop:2217 length:549 start_codon:yes stop_codon:yes gene_type:complete
MFLSYFSFLLLFLVSIFFIIVVFPYFFGAPWHPASRKAIHEALELCQPQQGEILYDLGCGDGRVLLAGFRKFNLKGVGVDIDPVKTWFARWLIDRAGLKEVIRIERKNLVGFNIGEADIIYAYLTHKVLDRILPMLKSQMKPGARLVCYRFCLKGEFPDQVGCNGSTFLYKFGRGNRVNAYS